MNKKMREIKAQIEVLNDEAVKLFEAKNLEGAESKLVEIENLEREYKLAEKLFKEEKETVSDEVVAKAKVVDKVNINVSRRYHVNFIYFIIYKYV